MQMKTLRLRDTHYLAARNSTAEVTAITSALRVGRDLGGGGLGSSRTGWLETPVTQRLGWELRRLCTPGTQRSGVQVTALATTHPGSCHKTGPRNRNTFTPASSRLGHDVLDTAPQGVCVTSLPKWPRPSVPSAPWCLTPRSAHKNHRSTLNERACPSRRPPPHTHPRWEHIHRVRSHRTSQRGSSAQQAGFAPKPSDGLPSEVGRAGTPHSQVQTRTRSVPPASIAGQKLPFGSQEHELPATS